MYCFNEAQAFQPRKCGGRRCGRGGGVSASMRPRPFSLGNYGFVIQRIVRTISFNEAQAFQPRKFWRPLRASRRTLSGFNEAQAFQPRKSCKGLCTIVYCQRRFNEAQAFQPRKCLEFGLSQPCQIDASMRPRPFSLGNHQLTGRRPQSGSVLQ